MKNWKWIVLGLLGAGSVAWAGDIADLYQKTVKEAPATNTRPESYNLQDTGVTEIGLERTACYGACPVYSVTIQSDGTFRYKGTANVEHQGEYTGQVNLANFRRLAEFIKETGYMDLESTYSRPISDLPSAYTTVVMNGTRKVIKAQFSAGPSKLWATEQLIDQLVDKAKWDTKGEEKK